MKTTVSKEKLVQEMDRYYFTELLDGLHPSIQSVSRDQRLLRLSPDAEFIQTLAGTFNDGYSLAPWHCADIITVPDDALVVISQAHAALMIAYLILDVQVDNQLPKSMRLAPLLCTQLVLSSRHQFARCLPPDSSFWADFDGYLQTLFNGLTAESASLDDHNPVYTQEVMRAVCHEKAAQIRLAARAMSAVANDPSGGDLCEAVIDAMYFGDQLLDDLLDWKSDWLEGRLTHPVQQVMEQSGLSTSDVEAITVEDLQPLMEKTHLEMALLDKTAAVYRAGCDRLSAAGYGECRWAALLSGRMDHIALVRRRQNARQFAEKLALRL